MTAFLASVWPLEAWRYLVTACLLVAGGVLFGRSIGAHRRRTLERALAERSAEVVELRVKVKGVDHGD